MTEWCTSFDLCIAEVVCIGVAVRCSDILSFDCRVCVNGVRVDGTEPSVCLSCDICSVGSV